MTSDSAARTWKQILECFEEKLQYSFVEHAKYVVDINFEGNELSLLVTSDEAVDFFTAEINQQRMIIFSRPIIHLDKVSARKVDADPIG